MKEALVEIGRMSIEEKIARLSEVDKAYVQGYVERAVLEYQKQQQNRRAETSPESAAEARRSRGSPPEEKHRK